MKNIFFLSSLKPAWWRYVLYKKKLNKECDLFICVSKFIQKKAIEKGFSRQKTLVHYIGIDTESFPKPLKSKNGKTILHVARLVEKKGTRYLLEAFSKIFLHVKDAKLLIIGEGDLKQELKNLSKKLKIDKNVSFLGSMPNTNVKQYMAQSDIFVLPSVEAKSGDSEGLGMVFLEASCMGLPIVATKHGGIPEVVKDGQSGFLVDEKSVKQLSEKILILLKNDDLRIKMGKAGKKFVKENFDIKKQTEKLEQIYQNILNQHA